MRVFFLKSNLCPWVFNPIETELVPNLVENIHSGVLWTNTCEKQKKRVEWFCRT